MGRASTTSTSARTRRRWIRRTSMRGACSCPDDSGLRLVEQVVDAVLLDHEVQGVVVHEGCVGLDQLRAREWYLGADPRGGARAEGECAAGVPEGPARTKPEV